MSEPLAECQSRLVRVEERLDLMKESVNRHSDWIDGHERWTQEQRDSIYQRLDETERRVMDRIERQASEFREAIVELKTRIFGWQIAGSIVAAAIAACASAVAVYAALSK